MKALALTPQTASTVQQAKPLDEQKPSAEALKAGREFEGVFLRTMLQSLEKTTKLGGKSSMTAGQSTYGSMVVNAMSDAMSSAGGIGLAEVVAKALTARSGATAKPK